MQNLSSSSHNAFGVQFEGMPWERVRNVSVDREGDSSYTLKPRMKEVLHRVICDVKLKDNVKIVTFRSAFQIENMTHLPMELVMIDANNKQAAPVCKIRQCLLDTDMPQHLGLTRSTAFIGLKLLARVTHYP